jgi:glycosyltransferase involved in cell wall biosynthesis
MRILYHSVAPWKHTGYATCTEEIATRLHNNGHEVAIQCLNSVRDGPIEWNGFGSDAEPDEPITVYGADSQFGIGNVKQHFEDFDADFYFTHFDTWVNTARTQIPKLDIPYSSYVIVDHSPAPKPVADQVSQAYETVAMSKFGKYELEKRGVMSKYIPHGVDTELYTPLDDKQSVDALEVEGGEDERMVDVDDTFIAGMIAANHGERKNIPNHLMAWKQFVETVDEDAILYIHTDTNSEKGFNLEQVRKEIGLPAKNILPTPPEMYGEVDNHYLNRLYDMFDVYLNCSMGESWGLTITEAQASGTPVIATNFSSMPEQLGVSFTDGLNLEKVRMLSDNVWKTPHGIVCSPTTHYWKHRVNSKQYIVEPKAIYEALCYYYNNKEEREDDGQKAREFVEDNYDWDEHVLPEFMDHFNMMEDLVV